MILHQERQVTATEAGPYRIAAAQRLVALDPLREASHRMLIGAALGAGERGLAQRFYDECTTILKRELGVAPAPETINLLQAPPLPGTPGARPSIAVLPFANLSDDPAQRYFSDGITADIITELSRFRQFQVRTHRPAKDHPEGDTLTAGRHLAVQYVTEGSVRRLGKRIRTSVQLLDVETGATLWSKRFDTNEEEVFTVQDKIVGSIAAQLSRNLRSASLEKATRKPPANPAAYELLLRGDALPIGVMEAETEVRKLFQRAVEIDPTYGRAHACLASTYLHEWIHDLYAPDSVLDRALEIAEKAVALDDNESFSHYILGYVHMMSRSFDQAKHHLL